MTPALAALPAAQSIFGGMAALGKARGERQQAEANAYIGQTRALQTATAMQEDLRSELGSMRAALTANGQGLDAGTVPFMQELRRTRLRERRVAVGAERQGAADWRMQGQNAMAQGRAGFLSGLIGAGPSIFDAFDLQGGPPAAANPNSGYPRGGR